MMMMMLQMFPPSVLLASLPDNLLTRKSCKQFDFKDFMTSRKKMINHKKDKTKIWAKRKPEGQRLSLKSQRESHTPPTYFQWKRLWNFQELPVLSTCKVKSKYKSKDVVKKERLSGIIALQEITPKTTQLEETEHICDSRSQPSPWDPNWFHPFLCKIAPTRRGLATGSGRRWTSKAGDTEEWTIIHHSPSRKISSLCK